MHSVVDTPVHKKVSGLSPYVVRLEYLDGLRALAALYVLVHHAILQVDASLPRVSFFYVFTLLFGYGRYAVDLFIVISGFCLMLPVIHNSFVLPKGIVSFFKRRARRILPTYYIALGCSLILVLLLIHDKTGTNWDESIPVTNWDILTHLFLIQDCFSETIYKINHTFWSISVEFHIYFVFPFLVVCWRKLGATVTSILSVFLSLGIWYILSRLRLNVYGMAPHYITLFTFGMLAAHIAFAKFDLWKVGIILSICLLVAAIHPILIPDFIAGLSSAFLVGAVSLGKVPLLHRLLSWHPFVFVGTFAYSIYLIHAPLLQIISQYFISSLGLSQYGSLLFFLLVGVPMILTCSYLFFLMAERPFMIKRLTRI